MTNTVVCPRRVEATHVKPAALVGCRRAIQSGAAASRHGITICSCRPNSGWLKVQRTVTVPLMKGCGMQ
jgi:hypothetical protein